MFGIPTFDLLTDSGKQSFVEYVVNLMRNEIVSYTSSYINSATNLTVDLTPYATIAMLNAHASDTTNIHGITDTANLVYQNTPYLDFDTVTPGATGVGQIAWNDTLGTLEFILKGGNVTLPIGEKSVARVKHADNTGLTKGLAVYVVGSDGTNKTVRYALADSDPTSSRTFGIMDETVTGGNKGFVCTQGYVEGINTIGLTEGAAVWLSPTTPGGLTTTKPTAPNHLVLLGFCVKSHAVNGSVYVHVVNGFELDELHDVRITSVQPDDLLQYDSTIPSWKNVATIAPAKITGTAVVNSDSRLTDTRTPTDASVTSPKFNIDYASAPTVTQPGALYYNTGSSKLFVWDGAAWDEVGGAGVPITCTSTTRPTSGLQTGMIIFESDTNTHRWYTGSGWKGVIPEGTIQSYAGPSAPLGWLLCDGAALNAVSNIEFAGLFGVIGINYGGSGASSFNVPDLRGRAPFGMDNLGTGAASRIDYASSLGVSGGAQYHTLGVDQLPTHSHAQTQHTHTFSTGGISANHSHYYEDTYWCENIWGNWGWWGSNTGGDTDNAPGARWGKNTGNVSSDHSHSGTTANSSATNTGFIGNSLPHNNMPPMILTNYIIKY